jgi:hypothetical protein
MISIAQPSSCHAISLCIQREPTASWRYRDDQMDIISLCQSRLKRQRSQAQLINAYFLPVAKAASHPAIPPAVVVVSDIFAVSPAVNGFES